MEQNNSILTQTRQIFKTVYTRIAGIMFVNTVLSTALYIGMTAGILYFMFGANYLTLDFKNLDSSLTGPISNIPWLLIIGIAVVVILVLLLIAFITTASITAVLFRNMSFTESVRFGATKGLRSIPVQMLVLLLPLIGSIPSFLIIFLGLLTENEVMALVFILLGAFLFLLPLVLFIKSIFAIFVWLENQKERSWSIVKKSFALTRGVVSWMIILLVFVLIIAGAIINSFLILLINIVPASNTITEMVALNLVSVFFTMPIWYAALYAIYEHAKKHNGSGAKKIS